MELRDIFNYIEKLNAKYIADNCNGIPNQGENFQIIPGKIPILLSAPHAVRQNRKGQIKGAETLTGPIVEFLCKKTGANGIIRTFNLEDDPNYENRGQGLKYKEKIVDFAHQENIKCLIDIHGCDDSHPFDIDIGTNDGININHNNVFLNIIYEQLSLVGQTKIDHTFKAYIDTTVCNYVNKKANIPCFQIELSASLRQNSLIQLLNSLKISIDSLAEQMRPNNCDINFER